MRSLLVLFVLVLAIQPAFAQKEGNNWYFGYKAGLSFNTNPPQVLFNGQSNSKMGHASISDKNGNLLFYFGGSGSNKAVYNRNHAQMPNGNGFHSYSEFNMIIPWPGQNKYYFFSHVNGTQSYNGYSIIDMSLDNGLGDVTAAKNVFLSNATTQLNTLSNIGSVAVKHRNNRDYWYINANFHPVRLRAYLISPAGLDTVPVSSNLNLLTGYSKIKASPDGRTLAVVGFGPITILDFDNTSGIATTRYTLPAQTVSVEFSPDGTKLFTLATHSGINNVSHLDLIQFDLLAGSTTAIQNSAKTIHHFSGFSPTHMQVGPDGKIYQTSDSIPDKYLHVIHRPNLTGTASRFQKNAIDLDPANAYTTQSTYKAGDVLPSFVQSFFYRPRIDMQQTCFGDTARFDLSNRAYADSVDWNFGDPTSGSLNTSKSFTPKHFYAAGGTYNVQAIVHFNFTSDTVLQTISIPHTIVKPNLGNDTTLCQGDTLRLRAYQFGATYEWQDSLTTDSVFTVTRPGQYWVQVSNGCGLRTDTINVTFHQPLQTNFGPDLWLCPGEQHTLKVTSAGGQILWQNGSTQPEFTVSQPGTYTVKVTNLCGSYSDTIKVAYRTLPTRLLPADTVLCAPADVLLNATTPHAVEYLWQDGSRNPQFLAKYPGTYWVQIKTSCNTTVRDNIEISYNQEPATRFPADTLLCSGNSLILKAPPGLRYRWNTGDTTQQLSVTEAGKYAVTVETAPNCFFQDSIQVREERCFKKPFIANIITPNQDNRNDTFEPKGLEPGPWRLEIYNRWGKLLYQKENYTNQWPEKEVAAGTYYYLLRHAQTGKTHKGWVEVTK